MSETKLTVEQFARHIDQAYLKPTLKRNDVFMDIAHAQYNYASYCVMPCYLEDAYKAKELNLHDTVLSTVIGFPHGNVTTRDKLHEIRRCSKFNVREYDIVVNYSYVLSGEWGKVASSIKTMTRVCSEYGATTKIIFENCYLTERHIITLCEICSEVMPFGYVKTSTGFGTGGATINDVTIMRANTKPDLGVKASGGIASCFDALALIRAGATRIGTSNGEKMVAEYAKYLKEKEENIDNEPPF